MGYGSCLCQCVHGKCVGILLINNNVLHFHENCIQLSGHVKHLHGNFAHHNTQFSFCLYVAVLLVIFLFLSFVFFLFTSFFVLIFSSCCCFIDWTKPEAFHILNNNFNLHLYSLDDIRFVLWLCTCCRVVVTATVSTATTTVSINAKHEQKTG